MGTRHIVRQYTYNTQGVLDMISVLNKLVTERSVYIILLKIAQEILNNLYHQDKHFLENCGILIAQWQKYCKACNTRQQKK